ncbi:MAG: phage holin, partial [Ruthenibacterium sp.]
ILAYFGLTGADMTSWATLGQTLLSAIANPYVCVLVAMSAWNAIQDPTTKGLKDSKRALTYTQPNR